MSGACLIFDFDGTVLDTEEPVYRSWAELWSEHGQTLSLAEWQSTIGTDGVFDPWGELERRVGRPIDPASEDRRRARRDELQARHRPRPGVTAWLDQARQLGVPVGIASSSPQQWVDGHLVRLGLHPFFGCVVCADAVVPPKPDPTSYRLACKHFGADPRRSVAVEDSPHGVRAAVAAGLFTVAVPHPLTADLDLSAADLIVTSLESVRLADAVDAASRRADYGRADSATTTPARSSQPADPSGLSKM